MRSLWYRENSNSDMPKSNPFLGSNGSEEHVHHGDMNISIGNLNHKTLTPSLMDDSNSANSREAEFDDSDDCSDDDANETIERPKSAYQIFIVAELRKIRRERPHLSNIQYMKMAAKNWVEYKKRNGNCIPHKYPIDLNKITQKEIKEITADADNPWILKQFDLEPCPESNCRTDLKMYYNRTLLIACLNDYHREKVFEKLKELRQRC